MGDMEHTNHDWAHLVAQAHGLYLRLRDRAAYDAAPYDLVVHAYERYQRRVAQAQ
jgi:hypothetical protein